MALSKLRIGSLITPVDERNSDGQLDNFIGININKEFMPTAANTESVDRTKYKIVRKNRFVFSGMQTGRDRCIRIGLYQDACPSIISPAYTTFEIADKRVVTEEYFFMLFLRKEMDRFGWFISDSSVRANLDWERFCEIELDIPSIEIQQKYVDVYKSMVLNQQAQEKGLDDLELVIGATLERFKHLSPRKPVGEIVDTIDIRNTDDKIKNVQGINIEKTFMPSVANLSKTDLTKYKVISKGQFAYSAMQTGRDRCIRIALFQEDEPVIISPAYSVLYIKNEEVLPEYFMLWFSRKESDRYGWFVSDGSVRASLELPRFYEIEVPVPSIEEQQSVVNLFKYRHSVHSNIDRIKKHTKDICPILIKGSIEEAQKAEAGC